MSMKIRSTLLGSILLGIGGLYQGFADEHENPSLVSGDIVSADGVEITQDQIDSFISEQMRALDMPGLSIAIMNDGDIVYYAARGVANLDTGEPVTRRSVFEAASLSKPVFAYFVLKLVEQGVIDLDRPLHEYLPMDELEHDPRYHAVTARMALSHQTGFPNWRWFDPAPADWNIERGTMYIKKEPGEFSYSGEGYHYLSQVVAHLTDRDMTTLDGLYQELVTQPLGMDCSAFIGTECVLQHKVTGHLDGKTSDEVWPRSFPEDTPRIFGAAGRLHTNAYDYARFMIALMSETGLSSETFEDMFRKQIEIPQDSDLFQQKGETGWSLGLAMDPTPYGLRYEHEGNNGEFQSGMMFFREQKIGYVFLTNSNTGQEFNTRLERFITDRTRSEN